MTKGGVCGVLTERARVPGCAILLFALAGCSATNSIAPPGLQEPVPENLPAQHKGEGVVGQVPAPPPNPPQEQVEEPGEVESPSDGGAAPEDDYAAPRAPIKRSWIYLGYRSIDEAFWAPVEDQVALGFEVTHERPGKFFGGEAGMLLGIGTGKVSGLAAESSVIEFYAGLRKTWGDLDKRWHPYVGFGASALRASFSLNNFELGDWAIAPYAHAGIHYDVSDRMSVGVDVRSLFASSIDIGGISGDVDYTQFALTLGWLF